MPSGDDLTSVDNELAQLTRALACSSAQNFLAACEESAHGALQEDLPTVPTPKVFPDPIQQLAKVGVSNAFDLSLCEEAASASPKLYDVTPPAAPFDCPPACDCRSCVWLDDIFTSNRRWAKGLSRINPNFFSDMAQEDTPSLLWIGCADSRVVPNRVTGLQPGSLYVHRNVGNVAKPCDPNCMSALEYSVNSLQVSHVVVCGHYGCNAVSAAMKDSAKTAGILNFWVSDIRQLRQQHQEELQELELERQVARLCELNVVRQVMNICNSNVVRAAWEQGQTVHVHGLIYDVTTGLLKRLVEPVSSPTDDFAVRAAAEMQQESQHMAAAFTAAAQELLVAQGLAPLPESLPNDSAPVSATAAAQSLARTAAAMQHRGPATSPPPSPRAASIVAAESALAPEELQALQEELAWVRSSEACAVDAAQHLMEQTWALLKEKQEMTQKMAEQAETIKWLEERLQFLESESEQLRIAAPTQLIKRYQELRDLPSETLTADLLEELHLLQGLMAVGSQFSHFDSPASSPHSTKLPASHWDKINDFFPHRMDTHFGPAAIQSWSYTLQHPPHPDLATHHNLTKPASKSDLMDQITSLSPEHDPHHKASALNPTPTALAAAGAKADKKPATGAESGTDPDMWYMLGAYSPGRESKIQHAAISSPSSNSIPPSSILSSYSGEGSRSDMHLHRKPPSLDSSGHEVAEETKSVVSLPDARMSLDSTPSTSAVGVPASPLSQMPGARMSLDSTLSTSAVGVPASPLSQMPDARMSLDSTPSTSLPNEAPTPTQVVSPAMEVVSPAMEGPPTQHPVQMPCPVDVPLSALDTPPARQLPKAQTQETAAAWVGESHNAVEEIVPDKPTTVSAPPVAVENAVSSKPTTASTPPVAVVEAVPDKPTMVRAPPVPTEKDGYPVVHTALSSADVNDAASDTSLLSSTWDLPQLPTWLQQAIGKQQSSSRQEQPTTSDADADAPSQTMPHEAAPRGLPANEERDADKHNVDAVTHATSASAAAHATSAPATATSAPATVHATSAATAGTGSSTNPAPPPIEPAAGGNVLSLPTVHESKAGTSSAALLVGSQAAASVITPSAGVPPSPTSSRTATLPPLPPKRAAGSVSGRSVRKRVVHQGQQAEVKDGRRGSRKEGRRSHRSPSSRASIISTGSSASARSSLEIGTTSSTACALRRMAEELQQLEDAVFWEEDYDAEPSEQHDPEPTTDVRGRNSKNTLGLHASRRSPTAAGHSSKGKVTFASSLPTTSHHATPAHIPPLPATTITAALHRHQPPKLSPIQERPSSSAYINYDNDFSGQQGQGSPATRTQQHTSTPRSTSAAGYDDVLEGAKAQEVAVVEETHEKEAVSGPAPGQKRRGGWLGAVGRASLAVVVGVIVRRAV